MLYVLMFDGLGQYFYNELSITKGCRDEFSRESVRA